MPGCPIGMIPGMTFDRADTVVPPDSNLLIVSDGAYEITQPDETMWTLDQLAAHVQAADPAAGPIALDDIEATIRRVRGVDQFEDDVSILAMRLGGGA